MGDENTALTAADARHLLRRSGFGARQKDVQTILNKYPTRGAAADFLVNFRLSGFKPSGQQIENRHNSWIRQMITTTQPLREKLVMFWHDHFATSDTKVENPVLMANQNLLLRKNANKNFKTLVKAINKDAAMIEFLDTVRNSKDQPNENYARELQELFTLGVKDYKGNRNYQQEDIVQIARAFSGWYYNARGVAQFSTGDHDFTMDYPGRGAKVIYKQQGGFGASGVDYTQPPNNPSGMEGAGEIDAVIEIIFQHKDSDGHSTVARYIAGKLFTFFALPNPKRPADMTQAERDALKLIVDQLILDSGPDASSRFDKTWEIAPLLRAMFVNDAFYATAVPADPQTGFSATDPKSVKWPVDYVVSTLRQLNMSLSGRDLDVSGGDFGAIIDQLDSMGQVLFQPPSVFGWDWETAWITSATLLARAQFAVDLINARGGGMTHFHPERLVSVKLTDASAIVTAVTDVLGITDQLTTADQTALITYLTDGAGPSATVDLTVSDTRNRKLNGLFGLVLQSPAYQLH